MVADVVHSGIEVLAAYDAVNTAQSNDDALRGGINRVRQVNIGLQSVVKVAHHMFGILGTVSQDKGYIFEVKMPLYALVLSHPVGIYWNKIDQKENLEALEFNRKQAAQNKPFIVLNQLCLWILGVSAAYQCFKKKSVTEGIRAGVLLQKCIQELHYSPGAFELARGAELQRKNNALLLWSCIGSFLNAKLCKGLFSKYTARGNALISFGFGYMAVNALYEFGVKSRYYWIRQQQTELYKKFASPLDSEVCKALLDKDGTDLEFSSAFCRLGSVYDDKIATRDRKSVVKAFDALERELKNRVNGNAIEWYAQYGSSLERAKKNIFREDCVGRWFEIAQSLESIKQKLSKINENYDNAFAKLMGPYTGCFATLEGSCPEYQTVEAQTLFDAFINFCHHRKSNILHEIALEPFSKMLGFTYLSCSNQEYSVDKDPFTQCDQKVKKLVEKWSTRIAACLGRSSGNVHYKLQLERVHAPIFSVNNDKTYTAERIKFVQDLIPWLCVRKEVVQAYFHTRFKTNVDALIGDFIAKKGEEEGFIATLIKEAEEVVYAAHGHQGADYFRQKKAEINVEMEKIGVSALAHSLKADTLPDGEQVKKTFMYILQARKALVPKS